MTIIVRYDHPKHAAKIQMQTADRPTLSLESRQELPEHAVVLETSYEVAGARGVLKVKEWVVWLALVSA